MSTLYRKHVPESNSKWFVTETGVPSYRVFTYMYVVCPGCVFFFSRPSGFRTSQTLDIEYRFDDKIPSASNSKYDKWRRMTFGKGGATFVGDSRVKLPFMKPNVYGVINYFITEVVFFVFLYFFLPTVSFGFVHVDYLTIVVDKLSRFIPTCFPGTAD